MLVLELIKAVAETLLENDQDENKKKILSKKFQESEKLKELMFIDLENINKSQLSMVLLELVKLAQGYGVPLDKLESFVNNDISNSGSAPTILMYIMMQQDEEAKEKLLAELRELQLKEQAEKEKAEKAAQEKQRQAEKQERDNQIKLINDKKGEIEKENKMINIQMKNCEEKIGVQEGAILDLQEDISKLQSSIDKLKQPKDRIDIELLSEKLKGLKTKLQDLTVETSLLKTELKGNQEDKTNNLSRIEVLNQQIEQLNRTSGLINYGGKVANADFQKRATVVLRDAEKEADPSKGGVQNNHQHELLLLRNAHLKDVNLPEVKDRIDPKIGRNPQEKHPKR